MNTLFNKGILFSTIFIVFILCVLSFILYSNSMLDSLYIENEPVTSSFGFVWPTPNYFQITSHFGYRKSPFTGKPSYHSGIDIGAPQGAKVLSVFSGTVVFIGFKGANGYTIQVSNGVYEATYSHLSSNFIVYLNQFVKAGDLIAIVGSKNVYDVPNNPYKDSNGNPTNGSTTGPHLHFSIKKERQIYQPP